MSSAPCIALVGDLHSCWDDGDARFFNRSRYDKICVTGDLGSSGARNGVKIARSLSRLERETLVMLGNNDAEEYARITAELNYQAGRAELLSNLASDPNQLGSDRQRVQACGFSAHEWSLDKLKVTVIAARPFALGGNQLSFPKQLEASTGFRSASCKARECGLLPRVDGQIRNTSFAGRCSEADSSHRAKKGMCTNQTKRRIGSVLAVSHEQEHATKNALGSAPNVPCCGDARGWIRVRADCFP